MWVGECLCLLGCSKGGFAICWVDMLCASFDAGVATPILADKIQNNALSKDKYIL